MRRYYIVMLYRCIRFVYQYLFIWLCITLCTSIPITRHVESEWLQYFDSGSQGPGSYVFGYDVEDASTNNVQFRHEHRNGNGTVVGSYGLLEPDGNLRIVHYVADRLGYRAQIENTKRQNEVYPHPTLYKEIINKLNSANDINTGLDLTTESTFLQSAEEHLPLLGQNYVHEQHIPPALQKNNSPIQESDFKNKNNPISRLYRDYNYYYY